jgi:SulP family sulfate permease
MKTPAPPSAGESGAAQGSRPAPPSRPSRAVLARDALAGITVALVLIPQALAYAGVAGMPPIGGLYAAALPPLAAALFASSPYLQTGPVALTSLLTFGALAGRAPVGSAAYVQLGILLALVVGVVRVLIGVLRGGLIAHLMSEPMLMGFMPASAILIAASQLPAALGVQPEDGAGVVDGALAALASPGDWELAAVGLALLSLAVIFGGRRLHPLFPGVLVVLLGGLALSLMGIYHGAAVGDIPSGLPPITLDLPYGELPALIVPGAVIAVVGFAEAASISRTYAIRDRRPWSADREFFSQGAANLVSGLSGGYPVGGSFSRSALNRGAGAVTRASGAITGLAVLAFLPIASVLEPLPKAVLSAIVISAVLGLMRLGRMVSLWPVSRPQFTIAATTFALTLVLAPHVEQAVLAGVGLALAVHLVRELSLRIETTVTGDTLEIRPSGVLWFATAQDLEERLSGLLEQYPEAQKLRIALDGLGRIDLTGVMALDRLLEDARAGGMEVEVTGAPPQARGLLARYEHGKDSLS